MGVCSRPAAAAVATGAVGYQPAEQTNAEEKRSGRKRYYNLFQTSELVTDVSRDSWGSCTSRNPCCEVVSSSPHEDSESWGCLTGWTCPRSCPGPASPRPGPPPCPSAASRTTWECWGRLRWQDPKTGSLFNIIPKSSWTLSATAVGIDLSSTVISVGSLGTLSYHQACLSGDTVGFTLILAPDNIKWICKG